MSFTISLNVGVSFAINNEAYLVTDKVEVKEEVEGDNGVMPNLVGMTCRKAARIAKSKSITLKISGNGVIEKQSIKAGAKTKYGQVCKVVAK
jgi:uncharacterized protein affecting Mg2+/Co2+ transport